MRDFCGDIDGATGRTVAEDFRRWPLDDGDVVVIEAVACVDAEITQSILVDVVLGLKTADQELISRHSALALPDRRCDARDVPQGFIQGFDVLLFHQGLGDHVDGLRCIQNVLRHAADAHGRLQNVHGGTDNMQMLCLGSSGFDAVRLRGDRLLHNGFRLDLLGCRRHSSLMTTSLRMPDFMMWRTALGVGRRTDQS